MSGQPKEALNQLISLRVRYTHFERNQQLIVRSEPGRTKLAEGLNQSFLEHSTGQCIGQDT